MQIENGKTEMSTKLEMLRKQNEQQKAKIEQLAKDKEVLAKEKENDVRAFHSQLERFSGEMSSIRCDQKRFNKKLETLAWENESLCEKQTEDCSFCQALQRCTGRLTGRDKKYKEEERKRESKIKGQIQRMSPEKQNLSSKINEMGNSYSKLEEKLNSFQKDANTAPKKIHDGAEKQGPQNQKAEAEQNQPQEVFRTKVLCTLFYIHDMCRVAPSQLDLNSLTFPDFFGTLFTNFP